MRAGILLIVLYWALFTIRAGFATENRGGGQSGDLRHEAGIGP